MATHGECRGRHEEDASERGHPEHARLLRQTMAVCEAVSGGGSLGPAEIESLERAAERLAGLAREARERARLCVVLTLASGAEERVALGPGATVDVLCCLHISQTSLETVKTTERTTCYAIDAEDFFKTFKDNESVFRNMQEHTVETQFKMCISNPSAPSPECFGTPLFMYSCDVLDARERDFLRRKRRKEAKEKMERERAMQWNAAE